MFYYLKSCFCNMLNCNPTLRVPLAFIITTLPVSTLPLSMPYGILCTVCMFISTTTVLSCVGYLKDTTVILLQLERKDPQKYGRGGGGVMCYFNL